MSVKSGEPGFNVFRQFVRKMKLTAGAVTVCSFGVL